jgi:predicted dehydrogenase
MHMPALAAIRDVEVVSIVSRKAASAEALAKAFGVKRWSTDYADTIKASDVDVVSIHSPNYLHAPMAIAAAEAGKNVICIKPLATSLAEADSILRAAEKAGVRLLYAENVPFIPAIQEARRLIASNAIGKVFRVKACEGIAEPHADWHYDASQCGGGAMIDLGVHSIEFCRAMADSVVETVYAETGTFRWRDRLEAEDTSVMTLRFANGVIGQCENSWSLAGASDSRFEAFGTEGRIMIDNLHRHPIQVVATGNGSVSAGWSFPWPMSGAIMDGQVEMFRHFMECLRTGARSRSEGIDGWNVMAVIEAAQKSMRSGKREPVKQRVKQTM